MSQFTAYDKHAEVSGVVLRTFRELTCFGNALSKILLKYDMDLDNLKEWYPIQDWLDVKKEIIDTFGQATIFFIGLNVVADAKWPPQIDTLEKGLFSINDAYYMNHRGGDIGSYETRKIDETTYAVTCCNPYPSYFDLGIIKGLCNQFCTGAKRAHVSLDPDKPTRREGAECCTYVVNLAECGVCDTTEPWVNDEVQLIHAVMHEAFNVMNAISKELEYAKLKSDALNEKLEAANQQLRRLATIDELTQVANRRMFNEHLKQEWLFSRRTGSDLSLIICDIDDFKQLNDTQGHQTGDACLRHVADLIKSSLKRPRDLAARIGGEEFAIILPDTDINNAMAIAEEIRQTILNTECPSELSHTVTLSFGVAARNENVMSEAELIRCADKALYEAKGAGKDRVVKHSEATRR